MAFGQGWPNGRHRPIKVDLETGMHGSVAGCHVMHIVNEHGKESCQHLDVSEELRELSKLVSSRHVQFGC